MRFVIGIYLQDGEKGIYSPIHQTLEKSFKSFTYIVLEDIISILEM